MSDSFNCYASSFELAAREFAKHPEAQNDESLQYAICRRYGIFLERLTDDEISELEHQIEMCVKGS